MWKTDRLYVNQTGFDEVAQFAGSIAGERGVFVTTSKFSKPSLEFVRNKHRNIVLIDGQRLGELMLKSGLGVTVKERFETFSLDEDYFAEDE